MLYPYLFDLAADKLEQNATVQVESYFLTKLKGKQVTLAKITLKGRSYYLDAKNLQLRQTNTINQYIARLNYPHAEITKDIYSRFAKNLFWFVWPAKRHHYSRYRQRQLISSKRGLLYEAKLQISRCLCPQLY